MIRLLKLVLSKLLTGAYTVGKLVGYVYFPIKLIGITFKEPLTEIIGPFFSRVENQILPYWEQKMDQWMEDVKEMRNDKVSDPNSEIPLGETVSIAD